MRTFQYTGKDSGTYVDTPRGNVAVMKGQPVKTDDEVVARFLAEAQDVKETTKEPEEKKPSPKPDAKS